MTLKVANVFQNGMVIQREQPVTIWGCAQGGSRIKVSLQEVVKETVCRQDGTWSIQLPKLYSGINEKIIISSKDEIIELSDVAVGEVFLAGGQSNMEFQMRYEQNYLESKNQYYQNLNLRFYDVAKIAFNGQKEAFDYSRMEIWRKATNEDLEYFSAVAYYFQKELYEHIHVPIGIIGCNWGGTSLSSWLSIESAQKVAKPWVDIAQKKLEGIDYKTYCLNEKSNKMNDTGNPFANSFTELMLPRTPSKKEIQEYFQSIQKEKIDLNALKPQDVPGSLYKNMVQNIAPFSIRAVLFYQGESDDAIGVEQKQYDVRLLTIMKEWRGLWNNKNLPFFIVQLPGFYEWMGIHSINWCAIRECQKNVVEQDDEAYLCSISDAGERMDIHPKNKKIVGERLSLLVRRHIFKENILCEAPRLTEAKIENDYIFLRFKHVGEGLILEGEDIETLTVTEYVKKTTIVHDKIIIEIDNKQQGKKKPVTVKFAMQEWYKVNLFNSAKIPAIPFAVTL